MGCCAATTAIAWAACCQASSVLMGVREHLGCHELCMCMCDARRLCSCCNLSCPTAGLTTRRGCGAQAGPRWTRRAGRWAWKASRMSRTSRRRSRCRCRCLTGALSSALRSHARPGNPLAHRLPRSHLHAGHLHAGRILDLAQAVASRKALMHSQPLHCRLSVKRLWYPPTDKLGGCC